MTQPVPKDDWQMALALAIPRSRSPRWLGVRPRLPPIQPLLGSVAIPGFGAPSALMHRIGKAVVQGVLPTYGSQSVQPTLSAPYVAVWDTLVQVMPLRGATGVTERQIEGAEPQASLPVGCAVTW